MKPTKTGTSRKIYTNDKEKQTVFSYLLKMLERMDILTH